MVVMWLMFAAVCNRLKSWLTVAGLMLRIRCFESPCRPTIRVLTSLQYHSGAGWDIEHKVFQPIGGNAANCYVLNATVYPALTSKFNVVGGKYYPIATGCNKYRVIGIGVGKVEVEYKQILLSHVCQNLVGGIGMPKRSEFLGEEIALFGQCGHGFIERQKPRVFQQLIFGETPLPARIQIAPTVVFTRKIYPFRMAKLISHKVEVARACRS